MAIVGDLGPPYTPRPHGNGKHSFVPFERGSHANIAAYGRGHKESRMRVYKDEVMRAAIKDNSQSTASFDRETRSVRIVDLLNLQT